MSPELVLWSAAACGVFTILFFMVGVSCKKHSDGMAWIVEAALCFFLGLAFVNVWAVLVEQYVLAVIISLFFVIPALLGGCILVQSLASDAGTYFFAGCVVAPLALAVYYCTLFFAPVVIFWFAAVIAALCIIIAGLACLVALMDS